MWEPPSSCQHANSLAVQEWVWHPVPGKTPKQWDDKSAEEEPMSPLGSVTASRSQDSKSKLTCATRQRRLHQMIRRFVSSTWQELQSSQRCNARRDLVVWVPYNYLNENSESRKNLKSRKSLWRASDEPQNSGLHLAALIVRCFLGWLQRCWCLAEPPKGSVRLSQWQTGLQLTEAGAAGIGPICCLFASRTRVHDQIFIRVKVRLENICCISSFSLTPQEGFFTENLKIHQGPKHYLPETINMVMVTKWMERGNAERTQTNRMTYHTQPCIFVHVCIYIFSRVYLMSSPEFMGIKLLMQINGGLWAAAKLVALAKNSGHVELSLGRTLRLGTTLHGGSHPLVSECVCVNEWIRDHREVL